jgi:hypothetical protein
MGKPVYLVDEDVQAVIEELKANLSVEIAQDTPKPRTDLGLTQLEKLQIKIIEGR